jgi:phenylpropionate dioxygenase-like ring-hydroxylating dioxygenase large terminal subunit
MEGPRPDVAQWRQRRCQRRELADVQRLPSSPGHHAAGLGQCCKNIVCPIHRWTYDAGGELIGAPHFPAESLPQSRQAEAGELAGAAVQGAALGQRRPCRHEGSGELKFDGYKLDHVELHECNYNWKTFIEVYLEDYHVVPYHPGLGGFVTCDDLTWQFGDWYSVQRVGHHLAGQARIQATYKQWHQGRAGLLQRRDCRRMARSGSPTTRTSWSSGIPTCWWCRR